MKNPLVIRQFKPADWDTLVKNAAADNHSGVYAPSVVMEKNNEIVGYLSMAVPVVLSWQDSKKMGPADFFQEIGYIQGALAAQPFICLPCDPESPYNRVLEPHGFIKYTKPVNLYLKIRQ